MYVERNREGRPMLIVVTVDHRGRQSLRPHQVQGLAPWRLKRTARPRDWCAFPTELLPSIWGLTYHSAAGQDATEAFYSLHRHEVIANPKAKRLQIGTIVDEESICTDSFLRGEPSPVPYAEPSWLAKGFKSPYFTEVRALNLGARLDSER